MINRFVLVRYTFCSNNWMLGIWIPTISSSNPPARARPKPEEKCDPNPIPPTYFSL